MNGTSVMTAVASLAWFEIQNLVNISDFITGATIEILNGMIFHLEIRFQK